MYTLSIVTKFHTEPHPLGGSELWRWVHTLGWLLHCGLTSSIGTRLRLNLHSKVLHDVFALWVESNGGGVIRLTTVD